jgi:hypothetical protein
MALQVGCHQRNGTSSRPPGKKDRDKMRAFIEEARKEFSRHDHR